ncbi:hypothetical protein ACFY4C_13310 [Actinomadura viridis]|uniref:hypothetical protein n=1 Tax=Actinomadura viridis TaxID=58110 RepID=UPI0036A28253
MGRVPAAPRRVPADVGEGPRQPLGGGAEPHQPRQGGGVGGRHQRDGGQAAGRAVGEAVQGAADRIPRWQRRPRRHPDHPGGRWQERADRTAEPALDPGGLQFEEAAGGVGRAGLALRGRRGQRRRRQRPARGQGANEVAQPRRDPRAPIVDEQARHRLMAQRRRLRRPGPGRPVGQREGPHRRAPRRRPPATGLARAVQKARAVQLSRPDRQARAARPVQKARADPVVRGRPFPVGRPQPGVERVAHREDGGRIAEADEMGPFGGAQRVADQDPAELDPARAVQSLKIDLRHGSTVTGRGVAVVTPDRARPGPNEAPDPARPGSGARRPGRARRVPAAGRPPAGRSGAAGHERAENGPCAALSRRRPPWRAIRMDGEAGVRRRRGRAMRPSPKPIPNRILLGVRARMERRKLGPIGTLDSSRAVWLKFT